MKQELKAVREAATNKEDPRVGCPDNIGNLQAAMGLKNDSETYITFIVCFFFFFLSFLLSIIIFIIDCH